MVVLSVKSQKLLSSFFPLHIFIVGLSAINLAGGTIVTKKMLDMFRRPDDPPEYNEYYLLPGAAAIAGSGALFMTGANPASLAPMLALGSALGCVGGISCLSSQVFEFFL
jgi:H+-translocating NAD(P) transhydrogenase